MQAMTEDKTYNGWTNYETWAVGMFLDGNYDGEGTYRAVLELAESVAEDIDEPESYATVSELRTLTLADRLKDFVEESLPEVGGIASDLLGAAVSEVNWRELAEHKLEEISES